MHFLELSGLVIDVFIHEGILKSFKMLLLTVVTLLLVLVLFVVCGLVFLLVFCWVFLLFF